MGVSENGKYILEGGTLTAEGEAVDGSFIQTGGDNTIDYSRLHNWNSSKISEARTRAKGNYGTPDFIGGNQKERVDTLDRLQHASGY